MIITASANVSLDNLDYQILNVLSIDSKRSYADIGKQLEVSSGTIFVRVKKMIDNKVILSSTANINYSLLGYKTVAYLTIQVNSQSSSIDVSNNLINLSNVVEVAPVSGNFNILCKLVCPSTNFLGNYIEDKVKKIKGVISVVAHIALSKSQSKSLLVGNIEEYPLELTE